MSLSVRALGRRDNAGLLDLAATSTTGSDAFRVDRAPDFFALGAFFGDPTYLGVFDDARLVGCIGLTEETRYLRGVPERLLYVHDLRIHPSHRATRAIVLLLHAASEIGCGRPAFGTVLEGSPHRASFERRLGRFVGPPRALGRTVHLGAPLFSPPRPVANTRVHRLSASEATEVYVRIARSRSFAPADVDRFDSIEGDYLGVMRGGRVVAVARCVDQSRLRRVVATQDPGRLAAFVRLYARMRGGAPMPRRAEAFRIGYLALYAAEDDAPYDASMIAHLRATEPRRFAYVFRGMSEADAASRRFGPLALRLASTTYAYGRWADDLSLGYHELTLV